MQAWVATITSDISLTLQAVPDGTALHPPKALAYTHGDDVARRHFLTSYKGCGVVGTCQIEQG